MLSVIVISLPPFTVISSVAPETFTSVVVAAVTLAVVAFVTFAVVNPVQVVVSATIVVPALRFAVSTFLTSKPEGRVKAVVANIFNVSLPSPPSIESNAVKVEFVSTIPLNTSPLSVPTNVSILVVNVPVPLI